MLMEKYVGRSPTKPSTRPPPVVTATVATAAISGTGSAGEPAVAHAAQAAPASNIWEAVKKLEFGCTDFGHGFRGSMHDSSVYGPPSAAVLYCAKLVVYLAMCCGNCVRPAIAITPI